MWKKSHYIARGKKTNDCWKRCIAYARIRYYLNNICAPKHSKAYTEMSTELIHKDANRYDILDKIKADEDYNPCKDCPDMTQTCYQKCVEYYLYRSELDRDMIVKKIRKLYAESLKKNNDENI